MKMKDVLFGFLFAVISAVVVEVLKPEVLGLGEKIREHPFETLVLLFLLTITILLVTVFTMLTQKQTKTEG